MGYWLALGLICISGIMGGIVYGISSLLDSGKTEKKDASGNRILAYEILKGIPLEVFFLGRAMVGAGGAIALVLVLIATKHYDNQYETGNLLFLTTVCFVAGFIGHRVLNEVASKLVKQIAETTAKDVAESKAKEVVEERVTEVQKENREYGNVMVAISQALQVLRDPNPDRATVQLRVAELEGWRKQAKYSSDRLLNIVLGNLYAKGLKDLDRAIQVLQEFTAEKLKEGTSGKDIDYADAMFNIACYYARAMVAAAGDEKSNLRTKALDTLKISVDVSPSNGADAETEADFRPLWEDPEFKLIVESGKRRIRSN